MNKTLDMYPNLQYNPIKIGDFTILEYYRDVVDASNVLGYNILPIDGLTVAEINEKVAQRAAESLPDGYRTWAVLPGREAPYNYDSYNHRICYIVYYNGEPPVYPQPPQVITPPVPAQPFNPYNILEVENEGSADTPFTLVLTIEAIDQPIEFYINEDYYKIVAKEVGELTVASDGVKNNGMLIEDFEIFVLPRLKGGQNIIKVPKHSVSHVSISYEPRY